MSRGISIKGACGDTGAAFIFAKDIRSIQLKGAEIIIRQAENIYQLMCANESVAATLYDKVICCFAGCSSLA